MSPAVLAGPGYLNPVPNRADDRGRSRDETQWQWQFKIPLAPLLEALPTWGRDDGE